MPSPDTGKQRAETSKQRTETGKQRAARIPLDYYKKSDRLERWKLWLGLAALLATGGWLAAGLLRDDRGRGYYSRGPVATVHVAWESNCNACHVPFTPINGQTWASELVDNPHAGNQRCEACHAGPAHHQNMTPDLACASCHRDHRGRDASLVRLADSDCSQCHRDLAAHRRGGAAGLEFKADIRRFAKGDHPEFRAVRDKKDPGSLKFNHKRHMTAGLEANFTLGKIPLKDQARYGKQGDDAKALVQLDCASCHQLDSRDFGSGKERSREPSAGLMLPPRSAGAYMLPISYEKHCQACHPLTVERTNADDPNSGPVAVWHRLQPDKVHEFLESYYTGQALKDNRKAFEKPKPQRPLPGQLLTEGEKQALMGVPDKIKQAERQLYVGKKTCAECHTYDLGKAGTIDEALRKEGVPEFRIKAPEVPDVWFKHGRFSHLAHRAVDCKSCHPQADPKNPKASEVSSDVMVPGIDNCLQCHAPKTTSGGGARFDCTECHRYHNGDHPLQGIGARRRAAKEVGDVRRFLSGPPDR
jgi:hypothetical protein